MNSIFRTPYSVLRTRCAEDGSAYAPTITRREPLAHRPLPTIRRPLSTVRRPLPTFSALALGITILLAGCASYQIGNKKLYPEGIRTVYVPMFESDSFRRFLGERLTEAVVKEIEAKTDYKVLSDPNADSTLSGRIVQEAKHVLIYARTGDPRQLQAELHVTVNWQDRRGRILRDNIAVPLPPELTDVSGDGSFVLEIGQSGATAQQQAIDRVAQQIVGLMENPW
jgi:hypothetical protein